MREKPPLIDWIGSGRNGMRDQIRSFLSHSADRIICTCKLVFQLEVGLSFSFMIDMFLPLLS